MGNNNSKKTFRNFGDLAHYYQSLEKEKGTQRKKSKGANGKGTSRSRDCGPNSYNYAALARRKEENDKTAEAKMRGGANGRGTSRNRGWRRPNPHKEAALARRKEAYDKIAEAKKRREEAMRLKSLEFEKAAKEESNEKWRKFIGSLRAASLENENNVKDANDIDISINEKNKGYEYLKLGSKAVSVPGSAFIARKGKLWYGEYKFESPLITPYPVKVTRKIEADFKIKLDLMRGFATEKFFTFEPLKALDTFLSLAAKIMHENGNGDDPMASSTGSQSFLLPWRYVKFIEGAMYLTHPAAKREQAINPFKYSHAQIHSDFEDFKEYFEKQVPQLNVLGIDGRIVRVLNIDDFRKRLPEFCEYGFNTVEECKDYVSRLKSGMSITSENFRKAKNLSRSPYLNYLSKLQLPKHNIWYLEEYVLHDMDYDGFAAYGYLFTISERASTSILAFEIREETLRSNSVKAYSTLIFEVLNSSFHEGVETISSFLSSVLSNKRQNIVQKKYKWPTVIKRVTRIIHNSEGEWKATLDRIVRRGLD